MPFATVLDGPDEPLLHELPRRYGLRARSRAPATEAITLTAFDKNE
jgi:hypothetical protein